MELFAVYVVMCKIICIIYILIIYAGRYYKLRWNVLTVKERFTSAEICIYQKKTVQKLLVLPFKLCVKLFETNVSYHSRLLLMRSV